MQPTHRTILQITLLIACLVVLSISIPAESRLSSAPPWTVFTPAGRNLRMSANLAKNPGFEKSPLEAHGWDAYGSGFSLDKTGGRGGGHALKLENAAGDAHGVYREIVLNQSKARPLYFAAWSRCKGVTGDADSDYSLYIDVTYTDGTPLWGRTLNFETGSHGWQFKEDFVIPAKPIRSISVYCLLRSTHTGTAWFDDISIRQVRTDVCEFDGALVATSVPSVPPYGGEVLELTTEDGLSIGLSSSGGAVTRLSLSGESVADARRSYASGFFVHDVLKKSSFLGAGGSLTKNGDTIGQNADISPLALTLTATYTGTADRIAIHAAIRSTNRRDRAVTLYFALPVAAPGWNWGDDIRSSRKISGALEFANFSWWSGFGARGLVSKYPWACISNQKNGIAVGLPLAQPRVNRLVYNPSTNQFYLAFDLGLSPKTTKFPSEASVDFIIYRIAGKWGFRAASQGYYDRFPESFIRRVPPREEGIWVAFADLSPIPSISDFGIAFHELGGLSQVAFDDGAGIKSFRYISEPWSDWVAIDDPKVNPRSYSQVMAYIRDRHANGEPRQRREAEATLSSGFFNAAHRYLYESTTAPWCSGVAGCAVFTLNPDPDIRDADCPLNKAHLDWNKEVRQAYATTPGLDGEYIDSYLSHADTFDLRAGHFAAADTPLSYRAGDLLPGIPEVFATGEFARWLTWDVHKNLGKLTMANGMLLDLPWGADLFDFMGVEVNWFNSGEFTPDRDEEMNYRRTLSYQRPYGLLMNTDFDHMSRSGVKQYFDVCLFYGIYPSMFSHNASDKNYWEDASLYNRDRPLYKRYIPLIRKINTAGWQPVTNARTSDPKVYIERFGAGHRPFLTVRNTRDRTVTVAIFVDTSALDKDAGSIGAEPLLTGHPELKWDAGNGSISLTLGPHETEILHLINGRF